jgi:RecB family endonuclease NucS
MYLINKELNNLEQLEQISFKQGGFKERRHLQEWIAKNPHSLGEPLLIIQKEFSGFDETIERLDLLALDEDGNIVVIENKLDDTGADVTWQALKYASYFSSLNADSVKRIFTDYLNKFDKSSKAQLQLEAF